MNQGNKDKSERNMKEISIFDIFLKIRDLFNYLRSKWLPIVCAGAIGGIIGITYAYFEKPVYKAELSFALEDEQSSGGGLGAAMGLASQFGIDLGSSSGGGAFSGDNLLELMRSRSMVEKTLLTTVTIGHQNQTLAELYITFNKFRDKWADKPELKDIKFLPKSNRSEFSLQQDSILGVFYKNIIKKNLSVAKIDKKLSIITITVNSKNELFSKSFSEVLVKTVSDFYIATKTKRSVQNVDILQHQTDSVRTELNRAITGVATSADVNPNANPALLVLRTPAQKRQVDVQADQAILTQLVTNLELSKISLRKETPLIQIIDQPILPLEKERTGKLMALAVGMAVGFILSSVIIVFLKSLK